MLVKRLFFLLNAALAMAILDLIHKYIFNRLLTCYPTLLNKLNKNERRYGMEINVEIPNAMRISRQILTDQKQMENTEYFNYLGSTITNYAICTEKIKSRIAMAKTEFHKTILFTSKRDLTLKRKLKVLRLMHRFVWC